MPSEIRVRVSFERPIDRRRMRRDRVRLRVARRRFDDSFAPRVSFVNFCSISSSIDSTTVDFDSRSSISVRRSFLSTSRFFVESRSPRVRVSISIATRRSGFDSVRSSVVESCRSRNRRRVGRRVSSIRSFGGGRANASSVRSIARLSRRRSSRLSVAVDRRSIEFRRRSISRRSIEFRNDRRPIVSRRAVRFESISLRLQIATSFVVDRSVRVVDGSTDRRSSRVARFRDRVSRTSIATG